MSSYDEGVDPGDPKSPLSVVQLSGWSAEPCVYIARGAEFIWEAAVLVSGCGREEIGDGR